MTSLRSAAVIERLGSSLFFVPTLCVLAGAGLGVAMVEVDAALGDSTRIPFVLTTTVDASREVLATVAQATITFAAVAFSVSLLIFQLASTQYSPRVVGTLFRDPFNRRVMGFVVGTFTYCLMVLRAVRGAIDDEGTAVIPNLSVSLAVVLGVLTILAVVAFIDHSAHTIEISTILHRVEGETMERLGRRTPSTGPSEDPPVVLPPGTGLTLRFTRGGWVQRVDGDALLELVPPGSTIRLDTAPGRYAVVGTPLCTIWPPPPGADDLAGAAQDAIVIGRTRTMQEDVGYGVRQLADVALKALSSGVNDPTTAQDAIFHMTGVLRELLVHDLPSSVQRRDGTRLIRAHRPSYEDLVSLAYDELRRQAAPLPTVSIYLLESLHLLHEVVTAAGLPDRAALLEAQAALVLEGSAAAGGLPADLAAVEEVHRRHFGAAA